jgi:hypothetical protein
MDIADQAIRRRLTSSAAQNDPPALLLIAGSNLPETITTACGLNPFRDRT